jgi:hypothetical protein
VKTEINEKAQRGAGRRIYYGKGLINKFIILLPQTAARKKKESYVL